MDIFYSIKRLIYSLYQKGLIFLLYISCLVNIPLLAAVILKISLYKNKKIREKKNKKKAVIIVKSGGVADVESAFHNKISNVEIFFFNRKFLIFILEFFLKKKIYDIELFLKKNRDSKSYYDYEKFMSQTIRYFKILLGNFSFFSFNFIYHDEYVLHKICKLNQINFNIIYKEGIHTKIQSIVKFDLFKRVIKELPLKINKLFCYNKNIYTLLLKNKLVIKKQIILGGCSRSYFSYLIKKKKDKNKNILFYFIDANAGKPDIFFKYIKKDKKIINTSKLVDFKKINLEILIILNKLSYKYENINFSIKSKTGHSSKILQKLSIRYPNSRLKFYFGGDGYALLKENNFVIGLNSTAILEAFVANKECAVPIFHNLHKRKFEDYFHYYNKDMLVLNKDMLKNKIVSFIEDNKNYTKNNNIMDKMIKQTMGNILETPKKLKKFIENN